MSLFDFPRINIAGTVSTWDAIWEAAARITKDGYVVEAAIPFAALHTRRATTQQLWGIQLVRVYPRQ